MRPALDRGATRDQMVLNLILKAVRGTGPSKLENGFEIQNMLAAGCAKAVVPPGGIKIYNPSAPGAASH